VVKPELEVALSVKKLELTCQKPPRREKIIFNRIYYLLHHVTYEYGIARTYS